MDSHSSIRRPKHPKSVSSFEYASVDQDHLPPTILSRRPRKNRKCKAGWMFLVPLLSTFIIPMVPIIVGYSLPIDAPHGQCSNGNRSFFNFFEIGIGTTWGNFTFTAAKSIDIAVDLVAGRGGQALIAYICYIVHLQGLTHVMESSTVSYDLYTALAFNGPSFTALVALGKRVFSTRRFSPRVIWLFVSTLYVLSFPTLISAMTGYVSREETLIVLQDGVSFLSWSEFYFKSDLECTTNGDCNYVLNGTSYDLSTYVNDTTCFSRITNRYGYGISMPLWALACIAQGIWAFGTYGLWVDANRKSQLNQAGRKVGPLRAVIDLGDALAQDLGTATCAYSEEKLEEHVAKRKDGLRYYQSSNGKTRYIGITSWKNEGQIDLDSAEGELFGSKEMPL